MCLSVTSKPQQWGGLDPLGLSSQESKTSALTTTIPGSLFCTESKMQAGLSGIWSPAETTAVSLLKNAQTSFVAHPASKSMINRAFFLWVKWPERYVDHLPPLSAEGKNVWRYISVPYTRLHGVGVHFLLKLATLVFVQMTTFTCF